MGIAVQGGSVVVNDLIGESPTRTYGRDSQSRQRKVEFAYSDADALALECFPAAPSLPGLYPGSSTLYVESLQIEPMAGEQVVTCGDVLAYVKAVATIGYATNKLEYNPETLVSRKWSFSGEFMTLPANSLKWDSDNGAVENEEISAAKMIRMIEHSLTRHRATSIPWTAIRECIGKVNTALLDDDIFDNVAAESLLYLGAQIDWTLSTDGSEVWTLEHRFQERLIEHNGNDYGWNHFWRPDKKMWDKLKDDNGNFVYEDTGDFEDLFT